MPRLTTHLGRLGRNAWWLGSYAHYGVTMEGETGSAELRALLLQQKDDNLNEQ